MTRLIFVRHGESAANRVRSFAGHTDAPLTDRGREQAAAAAEYLCRFRIDVAYASDLRRAYDTAAVIAARQGLSVIPSAAFREIYAGEWEGRLFADLEKEYVADFGLWRSDIGRSRTTGGESVVELGERIRGAVERVLKENEGKTVLIGTHATPVRVMACLWHGIPFEEAARIAWAPNASTTVVEYDGEKTRLLLYGYNEYLGTLSTRLPANV